MQKRRIRFVEKFQLTLALRMCAYFVVFLLTLWNLRFCWSLLESGTGNLLADYRAFAAAELPFFLIGLVLVPPAIWDGIKFCHRVAGPVYRVRVTMLEIADGGPLKRIKFRKGDHMKELEDAFNRMIDALKEREAFRDSALARDTEPFACPVDSAAQSGALASTLPQASDPV